MFSINLFRPKVIPVPIPLPVPVPVPIRGKSPFNIFGSHLEQSSLPNFPNHSYLNQHHHQHPYMMIPSPSLPFPYFHPGYQPYPHLHPPLGQPLIPPQPSSPNYLPFPSNHDQHLMATNQLSQKMILPYGLLPQPASAYHHHINQNIYRPSPLIDQHTLYSHGSIHPSPYYSGPFVIYI